MFSKTSIAGILVSTLYMKGTLFQNPCLDISDVVIYLFLKLIQVFEWNWHSDFLRRLAIMLVLRSLVYFPRDLMHSANIILCY